VLIVGAKTPPPSRRWIVAPRRAQSPCASRPGIHATFKYWIKPDIENRIKAGEVKAYFNSAFCEIGEDSL